MDKISAKKVKAKWYDPRTGVFQVVGEFSNDGKREFVAPSKGPQNDWVLVLEDEGKSFASELTAGKNP